MHTNYSSLESQILRGTGSLSKQGEKAIIFLNQEVLENNFL